MIIAAYIICSLIISALIFSIRIKKVTYSLIIAFLVIQWAFTIYESVNLNLRQLEYFTSDSIAVILLITLSILTTTSLFYSYLYIEKRKDDNKLRSIYFASFVVLIFALSCAYLANHIAIAWIFVEITTLSASVLIYHRKTERTLEATWKYIFICSVSVAMIFMGILILGLAVQNAKVGELFYLNLYLNAGKLDEFWLEASFLLVFTGYTAKAGLVPMFTAGIDAKDKAPSPASAIFSSALMNVGFIGIFRFYEIIAQTNVFSWAKAVLIISAVVSIFIAATYMINVKSFKRMFAYSSVEHMGIIMLGLASAGIGYFAAILHLILHSFVKAAMFYQYGSVFRIIKSKFIKDAGGYFYLNLSGALILLLGFFLLTAMPPSGLFVTEFMIFSSLFKSGYFWIIIVTAILLTVIIYSMGENIFKLLFLKENKNGYSNNSTEKENKLDYIPQVILLLAVIYLGFNTPVFLQNLIKEAVKNLL